MSQHKPPAIIYARISPRPGSDDEPDPQSVAHQIDRCRRYLHLIGHDPETAIVCKDEYLSARELPLFQRPGGKRLKSELTLGARVIVATKLDRLFRDVADGLRMVENWGKKRVAVHFADEGGVSFDASTANGYLVASMLLAIAAFEPRQTAERTSVSMRSYQRAGRKMSSKPPFGYAIDPENPTLLVPNENEQQAIEFILNQRRRGESYLGIASLLNDREDLRPRGAKFNRHLVKRVIERAIDDGVFAEEEMADALK